MIGIVGDVMDKGVNECFVECVFDWFGWIDIFVNNVGGVVLVFFVEISEEKFYCDFYFNVVVVL